MTDIDIDIDIAHLRTLAEKAIWYDDPTDWPTPDAVGFADDDSNNYVSALSPQTVLALLDEIERLRGEGEWEYGVLDPNGDLMYVAISLESATHGGFGPVVRRRPAGPWERVPEGEGDA